MENIQQFCAVAGEITWYKSSYEKGEEMNDSFYNDTIHDRFFFNNVSEFIQELVSKYGAGITKEDVWVDEESSKGRVVVSWVGDADGNTLSEKDHELWKRGEIEAYNVYAEYFISIIQRNTAHLLTNMFG